MDLWRKPQTLCVASQGAVVAVCDRMTYDEILRWQGLERSLRQDLPYPGPVFTFSDMKEGVTGTLDQLFALLTDREVEVVEMYVPHANGIPFGSFTEKGPTYWEIYSVFGDRGLEVFYSIDVIFDDNPSNEEDATHAGAA